MRKFILLIVLLIPCVAYGQSKKQLDSDSDGAIDLSLGGLGISLSDPGADRLLFWDDSATDIGWLTLGTTLSTTTTTLNVADDSILEIKLDSTNTPTDNYVLSYDSGTGGFTWVVGSGGLANVVEDVTPQLGGALDIQGFNIEGVDATEFGYVDGVTSDIQTQLNAKEGTLTNEAGLYSALSDVSLFLEDLVDDTTPQLGGNIDLNAKTVSDATGINDDDCTGQQGNFWWDSTDSQWEFCNLDSGTPLTIAGVDEGANYDWTGEHTFSGTLNLPTLDELVFDERADHVSTPSAGEGYIWIRSDTPSSAVFTDDAGTDHDLTVNYTATASKSAAYTIGTDDNREAYGGVIYVTSAATITIPAVTSGMSFTVITIGAIAVSVDPNASDKMYLDGVLLDDGDQATNTSTTGDLITCSYFSADGWYCASGSPDGDQWTDGG